MENILLVEHDYIDLEIFKRNFKNEFNIFSVETFENAMEILKTEKISAIIVEEVMPGFSGVDLLKTAKSTFPNLPRVLVTAMDYSDVMQEAINEAHVSFYLKKPFREEEMKVVLDNAIDLYKLRNSNIKLSKELKLKNRELSKKVLEQTVNIDHQEQLLGKYQLVERVATSKYVKLGDWVEAAPEIVKIIVPAVNVSSASIWIFSNDKKEMVNFGNYEASSTTNQNESTIYSSNNPNYFDLILKGSLIRKERLENDLVSKEIKEQFNPNCNIKAILDIPFFIEDEVVGLLRVTNYNKTRKWTSDNLMMLLTLSEQLSNLYINYQKKILESKLKATNFDLISYQEELKSQIDKIEKTQSKLVNAEKMAAIGILISGIAHEINNPINFVYGGAKAMRANLKYLKNLCEKFEGENKGLSIELINETKELLSGVEVGADRIAKIVKGLSNYSRLDDELTYFDINDGLNTILTLLSNLTKNKVHIVRNYEDDLPNVYCLPGQLNQVFMNVLSNAINAIDEKGVIEITTMSSEEKIEIYIKDNGAGIKEEDISKVFDPLFTTNDNELGAGIGLYISKEIIDKHKGKIEVSSKLGEGTEVKICIAKKRNIDE